MHGKPERQFLFTRSGSFRAQYEEWNYFYTKELFLLDFLLHTKY